MVSARFRELPTRLAIAAARGQFDVINEWISGGGDVNARFGEELGREPPVTSVAVACRVAVGAGLGQCVRARCLRRLAFSCAQFGVYRDATRTNMMLKSEMEIARPSAVAGRISRTLASRPKSALSHPHNHKNMQMSATFYFYLTLCTRLFLFSTQKLHFFDAKKRKANEQFARNQPYHRVPWRAHGSVHAAVPGMAKTGANVATHAGLHTRVRPRRQRKGPKD